MVAPTCQRVEQRVERGPTVSAEPSREPGLTAIDWLSERLLAITTLGERTAGGDPSRRELTVRGTIRLALKQAGLPPDEVSAKELRLVIERVLPALLRTRLVDEAPAVCQRLAAEITQQTFRDSQREDRFGKLLRGASF